MPKSPQYVVAVMRHKGKWVFVRHEERDTYELPGGRIEQNETPLEAMKREIYEETGAKEYTLEFVCTYGVERDGDKTHGMLYFAQVEKFGKLPNFEIAQRIYADNMPKEMTYPEIQPLLMEKVFEWRE